LDKKRNNSKNQIYRQVSGLPMGNPVSPFLANIFMNVMEDKFIEVYDRKILFFHRYLDDVLIGFSPLQLQQDPHFADNMKNALVLNYGLPCKTEVLHNQAEFLDLQITALPSGPIQTKTKFKPLNTFMFVDFNSLQTINVKRAWIKAELCRYVRNSSSFDVFQETVSIFYQRLLQRNYPHKFILSVFKTVNFAHRQYYLEKKDPVVDLPSNGFIFSFVINPLLNSEWIKQQISVDQYVSILKELNDPFIIKVCDLLYRPTIILTKK